MEAGNPAVGPIAQSVEQRTFNPWVDGSSPSGPTFMPSVPRLRHAQTLNPTFTLAHPID